MYAVCRQSSGEHTVLSRYSRFPRGGCQYNGSYYALLDEDDADDDDMYAHCSACQVTVLENGQVGNHSADPSYYSTLIPNNGACFAFTYNWCVQIDLIVTRYRYFVETSEVTLFLYDFDNDPSSPNFLLHGGDDICWWCRRLYRQSKVGLLLQSISTGAWSYPQCVAILALPHKGDLYSIDGEVITHANINNNTFSMNDKRFCSNFSDSTGLSSLSFHYRPQHNEFSVNNR